MSWLERRLTRHVQRAAIARWLKRVRAAEAIVWLAGVKAEAIRTLLEGLRCLVGDGR